MAKTVFFKLMDERYGQAKYLSYLARQCEEGNFHESFLHKIFKEKTLQNIDMIFS